jgi:hypothetical protein
MRRDIRAPIGIRGGDRGQIVPRAMARRQGEQIRIADTGEGIGDTFWHGGGFHEAGEVPEPSPALGLQAADAGGARGGVSARFHIDRRAAAGGPDLPPEHGGPAGPEPTRYGDWEKKGLAVDF